MTGTNLSLTVFDGTNNPKQYNPKSGPYVQDATLKIIPTTELSLIELKKIITKNIKNEKAICTKCLFRTTFGLFRFSALSIPKKSTQKEVVSAVKAESVVANVAAVNPSKKIIDGIMSND